MKTMITTIMARLKLEENASPWGLEDKLVFGIKPLPFFFLCLFMFVRVHLLGQVFKFSQPSGPNAYRTYERRNNRNGTSRSKRTTRTLIQRN